MVGRSEALYTLRRMSENLDMKWTDDTKQLLLFCLFCPLVAHGCDFSGLSQVRTVEASQNLMTKLITILMGLGWDRTNS